MDLKIDPKNITRLLEQLAKDCSNTQFLREFVKNAIEAIEEYRHLSNDRDFKGKIINIHPSLLPKYKGLNTFQRALKFNEKLTGCTVHFVNEKLDSGKIIIKKRVNINNNDNIETLKKKVQFEEYRAYSNAILKIFQI